MGERSFLLMKRAIIIANGRMEIPPNVASIFQKSDVVIAADGGIHNCQVLGLQPDIIIGDLDSIEQDELTARQSAGAFITRYPTHKDETDLELALQFALRDGVSEVTILGALGARWDMSFANVLLAAHPAFARLNIRILDGRQELVLLRAGARLQLQNRIGDTISLIPLRGDAHGIITSGLEYPLSKETLAFGSPRGVSNVIRQEQTEVFLAEGLLLCILDKREGEYHEK
jgi:thiamine pyrophosphokinase